MPRPKPHSLLFPDQHRQWLVIGRHQARHVGLTFDDAEDCAMEFVVKLCLLEQTACFDTCLLLIGAWLHKSARYFALNFQRSLLVRRAVMYH